MIPKGDQPWVIRWVALLFAVVASVTFITSSIKAGRAVVTGEIHDSPHRGAPSLLIERAAMPHEYSYALYKTLWEAATGCGIAVVSFIFFRKLR